MRELASKQQLRMAFLRWAVVTVPLIVLLGFFAARVAPMGAANRWYTGLAKPALTPPDAVFPIAWTLLYVLMGLAMAMVLNARGAPWRGLAIAAFVAQLLVNLVWSPLFFGMHQVHWSLGVIAVIFVLALLTTLLFGRIRSAAAWLLVPYLAWLAYAGALTWGIIQLNPDAETLVQPAVTTQIIG